MDDQESTYAPQSPDFSAYQASFTPEQSTTSYFSQPHPQYQASYTRPTHHDHQPHFGTPIPHQPSNSYESPLMPRNTKRHENDDNNDQDWSPEATSRGSSRKAKKLKVEEGCDKPAPGVEEGIEVKTKFPVARIKRIMQADEDIGKVAQVTPTAVCK